MIVLSIVLVCLAAWLLHRILFPPAGVRELRRLTEPFDGRRPAPYDWEAAERQLAETRSLPDAPA